jgi:hypothetical protein
MPSDLKVTLNLEIKPDGPKFNLIDLLKIDAYDRCDVELVAGGPYRRIDIQPGTAADQMRLLLVARSAPDPKKTEKPDPQKLRYQVNGKGRWIPLENWHLLMSPGFYDVPEEIPTWLNFENQQEDNVIITTLVARNAPLAESSEPPADKPAEGSPEETSDEMWVEEGLDQEMPEARAGAKAEMEAARPAYRTGGWTTESPAATENTAADITTADTNEADEVTADNDATDVTRTDTEATKVASADTSPDTGDEAAGEDA